MNPRFWQLGLLVAAGSLPACRAAGDVRPVAEQRVWVVDDGYHKGLVLPAELAPLRPDLRYPIAGVEPAYLEFGYSDRDWILGLRNDLEHLWRLTVDRGLGVLVVRSYGDLESALAGRNHRSHPCSPEQLQCLRDKLADWIDVTGSVGIVERPVPMYVISSSRPYTLLHNCRWFADSMLRSMQIDEDEADSPGSVPGP